MNIDTVTRTISFVLAPVVMISSCAILLGGLLSRYESISARMRAMNKERFDLLRDTGQSLSASVAAADADDFTRERLREIDTQLPQLLHRHKLVRNAVLYVYDAILILVASMLVIAAAVITQSGYVAFAALVVFLIGTGALLVGVLITTTEVRRSHHEVMYESQRVLDLGK